MAGSYTKTVDEIRNYGYGPASKRCHVLAFTWIADAADGSVPAIPVSNIHGFILKVATNPGSPAPTAAYDIQMFDADNADLDVFNGDLLNRSATVTEEVYPVGVEGATPVFICPGPTQSLSLQVSNNSVNSATGTIRIYAITD